MSEADTERFLTFVAYLMAGLSLFLIAYLGWRRLRRRHHHHHHRRIRPRSQQHRGTSG